MSEELDGLFETLENDLLSKYEYNLLLNYITNLQKENEKLKETLQTDKLMKAFMVEHSRNEKAVEFIKVTDGYTISRNYYDKKLLNILQGGDEE